ncbi:MAG: hypothetical protein JWN27_1856 [Candidatus Eremiobacteraeota bacterium]|jgi:hypothetical protein|nr:hypothetical protein [Candidatus Eremiobacteraeota bacterium]
MGNIREFTTVACPFDEVPDRLYAHFDGGDAVLPLRLRFGDLRVERDVNFHLQTKPAYPGYRLLDVSWTPKDGGPYPRFSGTLSVAEDGAGWSRIEIDGSYRPPFGIAGAAFDAAVGQRIAQATASELLAELKRLLVAQN